MNKTLTVFILMLAFIGGFLIFYNPKSASDTQQKWESKTDDQANVTITATPFDLSLQSGEWKFDVVMDTHSVELAQDLAKSAILIDDRGKEYQPLSWEGSAGGHHREGALIFSPVMPVPKSVELKIFGIGGVVRSFSWQLN